MLNHLKSEMNVAYTENGARAFSTTESAVLDFFAQGGALRNREDSEIITLFSKAFAEDNLLALKALFYFRDIRGGQGERRTFRVIVRELARIHTDVIRKNLHLVPEFGRWDDLYVFVGTSLEKDAFSLMKSQFDKDLVSENPSLLAKWLKSENASSRETKKLAKATRIFFGLSPKQYRKSLVDLRTKIGVVEQKMTAKEWDEINFEHVPSKAGLIYRGAFLRNAEDLYRGYLEKVNKGEAKIQTGTLYPYEIVEKVPYERWYGYDNNDVDESVLNTYWENQIDYLEGVEENSIVVADVSGSMQGRPMDVSVSLGMYLAERNKGAFHNHFITFSENPQLVELQGKTFCERVRNMRRADWGGSTNIEGVFDLILNTAVKKKVSQDELPARVYIVSDMEFNSATGDYGWGYNDRMRKADKALFAEIKERFESAGYQMPELVFWNVEARNQQFPMTMHETGTALVSGCSPVIFKHLVKGNFIDPYQVMLEVLNVDRYSVLTV